jgi:uncharacterized protein (DUF885 family)
VRVAALQALRVEAALALADVRMHAGEWSPKEAQSFLSRTFGMSGRDARARVIRLVASPGLAAAAQATALRIRDLREEAREREGASFSLKAFHDSLLAKGAVPVSMAARLAGLGGEPAP